MARSTDSLSNTLIVATLVCAVCSVLVSAAAVGLRGPQARNRALDKQKNILMAAGIFGPEDDASRIPELFERIEPRVVDLATGAYVSASEVDPGTFDQRAASKIPETSVQVPKKKDIASIRRRSTRSLVYLLKDESGENVQQVILPVHGYGLWSTLYGFLALDSADLNTVRGITFYQHGETPGLGGEIDNPSWKAGFPGKKAYCDDGAVCIEVLKGSVPPGDPKEIHHIDGLAGATITARGVSNLLAYWLGEDGFGQFISELKGAQ